MNAYTTCTLHSYYDYYEKFEIISLLFSDALSWRIVCAIERHAIMEPWLLFSQNERIVMKLTQIFFFYFFSLKKKFL